MNTTFVAILAAVTISINPSLIFAADKAGKVAPDAVADKAAKRGDPTGKERERTGVLKAVDTTRKSITVELQAVRQTKFEPETPIVKNYELAADTEILVEAGHGPSNLVKDAKLDELVVGALVTVRFSEGEDPTIESVLVSGPRISGVVESVDIAKNTIALSPVAMKTLGDSIEPKIYKLKTDADIALNPGRAQKGFLKAGKLADLKPGTSVFLTISPDLKEVVYVYASGPRVVGKIKTVNAAENTVTVLAMAASKIDPPEEKIYSLRGATIFIEDGGGDKFTKTGPARGSIANLTEGATVQLQLSVDQTTAVTLFTEGQVVIGILKTVDAERHSIKLLKNQVEEAYPVAPDAKIFINDREVPLVALQDRLQAEPVEIQARLKLSADGKQARVISIGEAGDTKFNKNIPEKGAGKLDRKLKRAE